MQLSRLVKGKKARWNFARSVEETVDKWKEGEYGEVQDGINNDWGLPKPTPTYTYTNKVRDEIS